MKRNTDKLANRLWEIERHQKSIEFSKIIKDKAIDLEFEILDFNDADNFMSKSENYPENKYEKNLYKQIELNNESALYLEIETFLSKISEKSIYVFFYNYNFGLVKINKVQFLNFWKLLIQLDNDEIMIFNPSTGKFLSIELTEDFVKNKEDLGRLKFYELTESI